MQWRLQTQVTLAQIENWTRVGFRTICDVTNHAEKIDTFRNVRENKILVSNSAHASFSTVELSTAETRRKTLVSGGGL